MAKPEYRQQYRPTLLVLAIATLVALTLFIAVFTLATAIAYAL